MSGLSTPEAWGQFLRSFTAALGADEWPGNPAASSERLTAVEKKLNVALPPSYRAFLSASNGWRKASLAVPVLRPAEKLRWFKGEHRDWVRAYTDPIQGAGPLLPAEQDYFNYGQNGNGVFDVKHLAHTLCISDVGDSAVLLLNPMVIWPDGEWETWLFANWVPGAIRFRSFADWMRHELAELSDSEFVHTVVAGEFPTVYLDGPTKPNRRVRPREKVLTLAQALKQLNSKTKSQRLKSVRQLGRIGGQAAIGTLLNLLRTDNDRDLRCEAAETLGRMRAEAAIDALIAAIEDEGVNTIAIHALSGFRDERSAECLLRILDGGRSNATVAAHVLGLRDDARAVEPLSRFLLSKDPRDFHIGKIAGRFIAAFQGAGLMALEPLTANSDSEIRRRAIIGLTDIAFAAREKQVKERAREVLRKCFDSETDPALRRNLEISIEINAKTIQ